MASNRNYRARRRLTSQYTPYPIARRGRPAPAIGPGAPRIWPGALEQFPLPLQALAVGEPVIRIKVKTAAEGKDKVSFFICILLHATRQGKEISKLHEFKQELSKIK
ncbi:hypothetical protein [Bradyrhizobium sp. WSM471]|uniref:hypothetical protein n=1 Tax=Bradyrhizobium sp. WSM471 TaxID=319017 RepID=UPI0018DEE376|nr:MULTISPECIES: hypothetical protein [Bradyrhizobium]UFW43456.1 hypothetical protein BcanWSM471_10390 [Bradyrhizobium canariense]